MIEIWLFGFDEFSYSLIRLPRGIRRIRGQHVRAERNRLININVNNKKKFLKLFSYIALEYARGVRRKTLEKFRDAKHNFLSVEFDSITKV